MNIYEKILELEKINSAFVVATVVNVNGSVPGKIGFKMIVEANGNPIGTVGGGAIEFEAIKEAVNRLSSGECGVKEYLLSDKQTVTTDETEIVPMKCSGKVSIYYEVHGQLPAIYIFGGGHVGQALLYFLSPLNYYSVLIDNRQEIIEKKNIIASKIILEDYVAFANSFQPRKNDFVVILTQGHKFDFEIVKSMYKGKLDVAYIGVIASMNKANELIENLKQDLGEDVDLSRLHSPIGLKIGGNTAAEIALSIVSEIQSVRNSAM
ncbi:MAG: XdhC/CoxI family protein [Ignavibacteriales bacterium]|nr:XdhC/CoxI family protein [Ignavibacteriales bacterium]